MFNFNYFLILFFLGFQFFFAFKSFKNNTKKYAGTITSIGILGTFTGICIALFSFDVSNIDQSVPNLLRIKLK